MPAFCFAGPDVSVLNRLPVCRASSPDTGWRPVLRHLAHGRARQTAHAYGFWHRSFDTCTVSVRPMGSRDVDSYPRRISRHSSVLNPSARTSAIGPTRAQTGTAQRGGHHASTLHGQHSVDHAARRRGCRHRASRHARNGTRRSPAVMLRRHRRRIRRCVASGRRGGLPHGERIGQQQCGRCGNQPDGCARDDPAARAGRRRQHERAGTHRRRL
ncbi:hypothetical protein EPIRMAN_GEN20615_04310 [Ralstonia mannitolilytica]|nr:hypothetical protein R76706_03403 [Ralstonia mannitolilytica]CAJ0794918.1 hypothetical protein R77555_02701 [Ralstonia mannitolilytica]